MNWQAFNFQKASLVKTERELFTTIETLHNTKFTNIQERTRLDKRITELKMIYSKALLKY